MSTIQVTSLKDLSSRMRVRSTCTGFILGAYCKYYTKMRNSTDMGLRQVTNFFRLGN